MAGFLRRRYQVLERDYMGVRVTRNNKEKMKSEEGKTFFTFHLIFNLVKTGT